jgi:hypothetical protein
MKSKCFTENKTYIKQYEAKIIKPQIGDYIICNIQDSLQTELRKELNQSIGKIIDIDYNNLFGCYTVEFQNVLDYGHYDIPLSTKEIIHFSPNKNDLETILQANKYNL